MRAPGAFQTKTLSEIFASDSKQALERCPVLVFANKSDVSNCMTVEKVHAGLNLAPLGQLGRKSAVVGLPVLVSMIQISHSLPFLVPMFCYTRFWVSSLACSRESDCSKTILVLSD
jgi:ADP-ribosylation factor family